MIREERDWPSKGMTQTKTDVESSYTQRAHIRKQLGHTIERGSLGPNVGSGWTNEGHKLIL